MRRFLTGLLVIMLMMLTSQAWSAENYKTYTLKAYSVTTAYTGYNTRGGVTTAISGTSDMTCTYNGTVANTTDKRTIDLQTDCPNVPRVFVVNITGVTLSESIPMNSLTGATFAVGVKFSPTNTTAAWAGASVYYAPAYASGHTYYALNSGVSKQPQVIMSNPLIYGWGVAGVSPFIRETPLPVQRYMRVEWYSGCTQFRNPEATITVLSY